MSQLKELQPEYMLNKINPVIDFYKKSGVIGIVLYGSWGRGEQLPDSDVDIAVICKNQQAIEQIEDTWWEINDYFVEPTVYDYEYLNNQPLPERIMRDFGLFWTEDNRFNWQQSKILYDPTGKTGQLIKNKAILPTKETEATKEVLNLVINRSLNYHLPRLMAAEKYAETQMFMSRLVNRLIHFIYSSNGLLMPTEKVAFYWFDKNNLTGKEIILSLIGDAEPDKEHCQVRLEKFWQVCQESGVEFKQQSPKEYLEYFFELNGTKNWESQNEND